MPHQPPALASIPSKIQHALGGFLEMMASPNLHSKISAPPFRRAGEGTSHLTIAKIMDHIPFIVGKRPFYWVLWNSRYTARQCIQNRAESPQLKASGLSADR